MGIHPNFYIDTIRKSPFYKTPPESFWHLIQETLEELSCLFPDRPRLIQVEAINKLIIAYCLISSNEFNERFTHYKEVALRLPRDPPTLWKTISIGVLSPELEGEYLKSISAILPRTYQPPQETPEETKPGLRLVKKPFSLKIAMRLCKDLKLDPRWEKLFPCSKELLYRLIFRTYRKDTIRKLKQALANGETYFAWCLTGIKSLSKQLTYRPKSSKKVKHYEDRQVRRALRQLWDLGFVHRIFRGYEDQGAGKYHVFLNPKMSATFNQARVKIKQGDKPKKRRSRMS
jgi:hypothetical protein